jgi:hypothetical protein
MKAIYRSESCPDGGHVIVGNTDQYCRAFEIVLTKTDSTGKAKE